MNLFFIVWDNVNFHFINGNGEHKPLAKSIFLHLPCIYLEYLMDCMRFLTIHTEGRVDPRKLIKIVNHALHVLINKMEKVEEEQEQVKCK